MSLKGMVRTLCVAAVVALFTVGCAKKPKLNLTNLRNAPNGGAANIGAGVDDPNFVGGNGQPELPAGFEPLAPGAGNGGAGEAGGNGSWGAMDQPVGLPGDASSILVNGRPWEGGKVYFDYNRSEIKANQRPVIEQLADYLTKNPAQAVVIEGHCDERGSDEYNRALSERRALAIRDYLGTLGIAQDRMATISYGEDRPEVPNATSESQHRLNRRGQFLVGDKK